MTFDFEFSEARYPETIRTRAPRGYSAALRQQAKAEGLTVADLLRAMLREKLEATALREPRKAPCGMVGQR